MTGIIDTLRKDGWAIVATGVITIPATLYFTTSISQIEIAGKE